MDPLQMILLITLKAHLQVKENNWTRKNRNRSTKLAWPVVTQHIILFQQHRQERGNIHDEPAQKHPKKN